MIPTASEWTVILSKQASAWGSFSYDPKDDVLRVQVTPKPAELRERLGYTFEDPEAGSVVATLRWEKLAVPLAIEVDSRTVVADSLREQLRGLPRFSWQPWSQAADAFGLATENEINLYGYQLMGQGKVDSAIVVLRKNTKDYPKSCRPTPRPGRWFKIRPSGAGSTACWPDCAEARRRAAQSVRRSSTRRFCARPEAVLLLATGWSQA